MTSFPPVQNEDYSVIVPIALATMGYLLYWYISFSPGLLKRIQAASGKFSFSLKKVLFQRLTGILFLGIIPSFITLLFLPFDMNNLGVNFSFNSATLIWIFALSIVLISLSYYSRNSPENKENYPQIRMPNWNIGIIFLNIVSWAGFLLAYEFLFRGILLFPLVKTIGIWQAICINVCLYALVHFPKGPRETLGAIPLGIVLCIATINTGTIWVAFLVHLFMALSNDYFSIKSQKNYKFI
ncbi:MAG: CPBP family intramembrane metalloprotease [Bacteroidales bacterium]|nr:CPBP family intramembrane metalloprotease [Bacteroidales bacterium]